MIPGGLRKPKRSAAEANTTITSWVNWAKANGNGKVATLGWCLARLEPLAALPTRLMRR